jgi:phage/plasmid primase, P4 family, C-terminal domain
MISVNYKKNPTYLSVYNGDIEKTLDNFDFVFKHKMDSKTIQYCKDCVIENWDYIKNKNSKDIFRDAEAGDQDLKQVVEQASELIMQNYRFVTIEETEVIWYYDKGVYVQGGEILIEKQAEKLFGYKINDSRLTEIKGHIMRRTYHKHEELDADHNIINLKNGLYDIDNDVLKEHTPDYLSINQKPIFYEKDAKPRRFGSFLSEVLYPRNIRTVVEAMAYTFERDYPIEVIFVFHGIGRNGKSVVTSTLTEMHGRRNVSNVSLSQMIGDMFALSDLEGKHLNIDNELGSQTIRETGVIKRLTGGSRQPVRIQRKNQRAYDTILYAKLFFNANKVPLSTDDSDAYNRRVIIIAFPWVFEGEKEDKNLLAKLTAKEEISGIFNALMSALRRVRKTGDIYVNEQTTEEKRIKYERTVFPVKSFMDEAIVEESTADSLVTKQDFYRAYEIYCKKYTLTIDKYDTFCKRVKNVDWEKYIGDIRKDEVVNGEKTKVSYWQGVVLTPEYAPKDGQARLD